MLNVFTLSNGRLFQEEIESLEELSKFRPIWVDLEDPTPEEKRWVRQYYGLSIPEDAIDEDIEESARFYEEDNGELHIRSDFLIDDHEQPRSVRVAFILNLINPSLRSKGVLFSLHDEDIPVFRLLRLRARRAPGLIEDARDVLLKLFDADAEYSADTLEGIYDDLEKVSTQVLAGDVTDARAGEVLAAIAREVRQSGNPIPAPAAIFAGGETTVTLRGTGLGGRNQEMALSFAIDVQDMPGILLATYATDGRDGPTDAAGAIATGETVSRARAAGLDPTAFLLANDSWHFFDQLGDLIRVPPTSTNVNDVTILLIA